MVLSLQHEENSQSKEHSPPPTETLAGAIEATKVATSPVTPTDPTEVWGGHNPGDYSQFKGISIPDRGARNANQHTRGWPSAVNWEKG